MDWVNSIDDAFFRFVTRGEAWWHVVVFVPVGLVAGVLVARWSASLVARESAGTRTLSRRWQFAIVLATAALNTGLVLAMIQGRCQSLTEGGSINWAQWRLVYQFILIGLLIAATTIDFDQYLIPDAITIPGTIVGVAVATLLGNMQIMQVWVDWNQLDVIHGPYIPEWIKLYPHWHGLAWSVTGLTVGAGITWLARLVSTKMLHVEALGFGDVTLMAMIGSFLGWQAVVCVFLLAPVCGIVIGLSLKLLAGRRALPYGPYLSAGALIVLFTWHWIWTPTRDVFGHWPTLAALAAGLVGGMAFLLGLLRAYRAIPVTRRREIADETDKTDVS